MRKVSAKHTAWLERELPVLEREGVLSAESARDLRAYYETRTASGLHWAVVAFAVLGSLLIGAGVILLFAHNWEQLGRPARAALSFCPLLLGAAVSVIALAKNGGMALRESAGGLHALGVGSSIALIGQTYHIPGDAPGFMLTWSLLILPLCFLLRSTVALLIYLALICGWAGAAEFEQGQALGFWLLLAPAAAGFWREARTKPDAPSTLIAFFGVLVALALGVGIVYSAAITGLWIVVYATLFSAAALFGARHYAERTGWSNPPKTFGVLGVAALAYVFTWSELWLDLGWNRQRSPAAWETAADLTVAAVFLAAWASQAWRSFRRDSLETITHASFALVALAGFLLGLFGGNGTAEVNALLFNGFLLFFGIMYVVLGCRDTRLRQLNGGMAVLAVLLVTRFFDAGFGFLARGVVFILLGACFLTANLIIAKRKKRTEVPS